MKNLFHFLTISMFAVKASGIGIAIDPAHFAPPIERPRTPIVRPDLQLSRQVVLESAEIATTITQNAAITRVTHTFRNVGSNPAEAQFLYPLPPNAAVSDLVLKADGQTLRGEILDKEEASRIYQSIVAKLRDPALLEWAEDQLIRVSMFPIPPGQTQTVEVTYSESLLLDQGLYQYRVSLRRGVKTTVQPGASPKIKYDASISSDEQIRYSNSPSHALSVRDEQGGQRLSSNDISSASVKDLVIYFEPKSDEIQASLDAFRRAGEDGYFMLQITPPPQTTQTASVPLDVIFVLDISGSMNENEKIDQAKSALKYCVTQLKEKDRFTIIPFSSSVRSWKSSLAVANTEARQSAEDFVSDLRATGGTNIAGALKEAVDIMKREGRGSNNLSVVVFLTDGLPTIGQREPEAIIKESGVEKLDNTRVFTFGVGNNVNTKLLDRLALETRAASDYIQPDENLEVPVSRFYDKLSKPALTDLNLSIGDDVVYDMFPVTLPDLFYNSSLQVFGRYRKSGPVQIGLSGNDGTTSISLHFDRELSERNTESRHVEQLWAVRKLGFLVTQLKQHGENPELKDEITQLGKKYGLVTPYTSYLAAPEQEMMRADRSVAASRPARSPGQVEFFASDGGPVQRSDSFALKSAPMSASQADSGQEAVDYARRARSMREATVVTESAASEVQIDQRTVAGRQFTLRNGVWVEESIAADVTPDLKIAFASSAWIKIADLNQELRDIFALGDKIIMKLATGKILSIEPQGIETIDDSTIREWFP